MRGVLLLGDVHARILRAQETAPRLRHVWTVSLNRDQDFAPRHRRKPVILGLSRPISLPENPFPRSSSVSAGLLQSLSGS